MSKDSIFFDKEKIANIFFYSFPLLMLIGPAMINIALLIILILCLINLRIISLSLNNFYLILLFFWIYITLSSFFSDNIFLSFKTSFSQIKFYTMLIFLFLYLDLNNKNIQNKASFFWSIILLFVCFDTNFQNLCGLDIFGYKAEGYNHDVCKLLISKENIEDLIKIPVSLTTDRLSGPFGSELIVGAYLTKTSPFLFYYILDNYNNFSLKKKLFFILILSIILQTVFISGERTSFIIILTLYLFTFIKLFRKNLFKIFLIFILILLGLTQFTPQFEKKRYKEIFQIANNYNDSSYGRLANSSIEIFKVNFIFGVGIKGFRQECPKIKDKQSDNQHPPCSTHPHNGPLELASETGIIGLLLFIFFIFFLIKKVMKDFKLKKPNHYFIFSNNIILLIVPLFYLIPILPNGSLFTSWNGAFFWFSLGLSLSLSEKIKKIIY